MTRRYGGPQNKAIRLSYEFTSLMPRVRDKKVRHSTWLTTQRSRPSSEMMEVVITMNQDNYQPSEWSKNTFLLSPSWKTRIKQKNTRKIIQHNLQHKKVSCLEPQILGTDENLHIEWVKAVKVEYPERSISTIISPMKCNPTSTNRGLLPQP